MQAIRDIRLSSHQLVEPEFNTPKEVANWMGAIQAQDYAMSKQAIVLRMKSPNLPDVERALNQGEILRTHVMRPTWHLVAAENIRGMLQLSKKRIQSSTQSRDRDLDISEALYSKCNDLIIRILEGNKHLTREELGLELSKAGIGIDCSRMIHFMMRAEIEGIICSGVDRGKKQTYALLDERVPPEKELHKEEALVRLATHYFRSHSPASLQDFVWWSGLSVSEARQAIGLIDSELIADRFASAQLFVHQSCKAKSYTKEVVHFLPAFDEYIIAYRDRTSVIDLEHQPEAFTKNGIFRPVILRNGKVVGTWKKKESSFF